MVRDAQGNLYGTTMFGADLTCNVSLHPGCGTVWRLGAAGNLTALHTFTGGALGGGGSGLVLDGNGKLFGAASGGLGYGFVFEIDENGTFTDLYDFAGGSDGDSPTGYFFRDAAGNLYGTTFLGGGSNDPSCPNHAGCGTVFELGPTGQHKVLYSFLNNSDGAGPQGVTGDGTGNLFGTTIGGGQGCPQILGCGTIFKLDASGNKTVLHYFTGGSDGSTPSGSLALNSAGNLYGVASAGGDLACPYNGGAGCGVVFKLDTKGVLTILHAFHGGSDGGVPNPVILDAAGNLYGSTQSGPSGYVCGTVFKLDALGNLTNLQNFAGPQGCSDGPPVGALVLDSAGNLYGATVFGGYSGGPAICLEGCGTVFKITP
jgi:uncharacterized repeat protein (TIGR03803 family)